MVQLGKVKRERVVRKIRMLRLTRRGWRRAFGNRAVLDPTCEGMGMKFPRLLDQ
jgi:hypothetical protein